MAKATRNTVVLVFTLKRDGPMTVLIGTVLGTNAALTVWFQRPSVLELVFVVSDKLPAAMVKLVDAVLVNATWPDTSQSPR